MGGVFVPVKTCSHEVLFPAGVAEGMGPAELEAAQRVPEYAGAYPKTYPFELDPFQKASTACIEKGESVLVAAHTSAGKTVVAEYAIAKCLQGRQRVIYTSPLKALSNQKFRELSEEFGDVGIMTGDVSLRPNASCLVMTTEILRSMLYRGSEVVAEVAWVVFDEIHYMQDRERGLVWEETIVLLPKGVRMVFLSATLPNATEFAGWIAQTHRQPCHVVYTDYRPTPLQHFVYPTGGKGLFLVVDQRGNFRDDNFLRAAATLANAGGAGLADGKSRGGGPPRSGGKDGGGGGGGGGKGGPGGGGQGDVLKVVRLIQEKGMEPAVVFSFSRRECEGYALACGKLRFNSDDEEAVVETVFANAIACLSPEDRQLPQIEAMLPLLKRGVACHHSGLLPILKELVEILFQEGLVKCLFATETFAMGLNMPARTVVFTATHKWDGEQMRVVQSGEYTQMSGRAGRRGKDTVGFCILLLDDQLDLPSCKDLMRGKSKPLMSQYRLSYYTLLNLLRVPGENPEHIIKNSFHQFQHEREMPAIREALEEKRDELARLPQGNVHEQDVRKVLGLTRQIRDLERAVMRGCMTRSVLGPHLERGRLVYLEADAPGGTPWGIGVLVRVLRSPKARPPKVGLTGVKRGRDGGQGVAAAVAAAGGAGEGGREAGAAAAAGGGGDAAAAGTTEEDAAEADDVLFRETQVEVLVAGIPPREDKGGAAAAGAGGGVATATERARPTPCDAEMASGGATLYVLPFPVKQLGALGSGRVLVPADLRQLERRQEVWQAAEEQVDAMDRASMPRLDPVKDLGVSDASVLELVKTKADCEKGLARLPLAQTVLDIEAGEADSRVRGDLVDVEAAIRAVRRREAVEEEIQELERRAEQSQLHAFQEDLKNRAKVMRKLGLVSREGVVQLKGRAACEVDSADELLATELLFEGAFLDLDPHQTVALLACLVPVEKTSKEADIRVPRDLEEPFNLLKRVARRVATVQLDAGVFESPMQVTEYVDSFKATLLELTYRWSKGAPFAEIIRATELFEGSLIRAIRRLDEMLRQLGDASTAIGSAELRDKFTEGMKLIKRDIVFANSLYL